MNKNFIKRKKRTRSKILVMENRPRVSVFRSNKELYAQVIDDVKGVTVLSYSSKKIPNKLKIGKTKTDISRQIGINLAIECKKKKITKLVLDRGGYRYHGRVKAMTEGLREGGIKI